MAHVAKDNYKSEISSMMDTTASFDNNDKARNNGVWMGIDFGTSNCACSVWDMKGGRAKVLRLKHISRPSPPKVGRIVPSAVLISQQDGKDSSECSTILHDKSLSAVVGQLALKALHETENKEEDVLNATMTSVKRVLGMTSLKKDFLETLPFDVIAEKDGQVSIELVPLHGSDKVRLQPVQVVAILLHSIRMAAREYLDTTGRKKQLAVPGGIGEDINNCVVGVPAHFGHSQRLLLKRACRMAGFRGHVSLVMESTAAAMAYGLFVSTHEKKNILVFDMGGGTTDVTIATMNTKHEQENRDENELGQEQEFLRVVVTEGDGQLGGNDMDELLCRVVLKKLDLQEVTPQQHRLLLWKCRRAKEDLCDNGEGATTTISFENHNKITVSNDEFNQAIASLVERARRLVVDRTLTRFAEQSAGDVHEVILVGGATRVPAIREMLHKVFESSVKELCCSLNAETAVAQGAAIQAAIRSNLVPKHELRSALMLDALPHTIGVLCGDDTFVPILEKDAPLPAMGHATFTLASMEQPGVTLKAVEQVGQQNEMLQDLGTFTFLLRKLSDKTIESLGNQRTVDIGMTLETSGKFIVSIFDWNDPEHLEKKRRYQQEKSSDTAVEANLGYIEEETTGKSSAREQTDVMEENFTMEQVMLLVASCVLFLLYIAAKLAFSEAPEESARIL